MNTKVLDYSHDPYPNQPIFHSPNPKPTSYVFFLPRASEPSSTHLVVLLRSFIASAHTSELPPLDSSGLVGKGD